MVEQKFDVAKGNKDWYGKEAIIRNQVASKLRSIFERYGYEPIETPIIETREALAFKGGGEIQKEVFQLKDQGSRELALRFDQTVPLARFVATHSDIALPFKRYVIGPVFRDGPTQPEQGRFRQFTQCDVDVLGVKEMTAEAELFALAQDAFSSLGLGDVEVKINNRKLLDGVLDYAGIPDHAKLRAIITLDKMDKIGLEGVRDGLENLTFSDTEMSLSNELLSRLFEVYDREGAEQYLTQFGESIKREASDDGFSYIKGLLTSGREKREVFDEVSDYKTRGKLLLTKKNVEMLIEAVQYSEDNETTYRRLVESVKSTKGAEGLKGIRQLLDYSRSMGFDFIKLDPSLARGLDYYTGTTIEVYLKNREIVKSAILAGGRFDDMVGDFRGGGEIPAVGFSFGLERLVMIMESKEGSNILPTNTQVYLIPMGTTDQCLRISHELRRLGVNVDIELRAGRKIGKSIGYADSKGIPYVGIIGENELRDGTISLKELATKTQRSIKVEEVPDYISKK